MQIDSAKIVTIARRAGDEILLPGRADARGEQKADGSVVTNVDRRADAFIGDALRLLVPTIPVVSEEASVASNIAAAASRLHWIVDPLDGTRAYLSDATDGSADGFGVHIALIDDGRPVKGVCYFPARRQLFYTGNDGAAYLEHEPGDASGPLRVPRQFDGETPRVAVPWAVGKRPRGVSGFGYTPVPATGGEMLCRVVTGEAELMWNDRPDKSRPLAERDVFSHWDVAAAHAVLRAAGGDLFDLLDNRPVSYAGGGFTLRPCIAAHRNIMKAMCSRPPVSASPDPDPSSAA